MTRTASWWAVPALFVGTILLGMADPLLGTLASTVFAFGLLHGRPTARVVLLCVGVLFAVHWLRLTDPFGWDTEVRPTRREPPASSWNPSGR